MKRNLLYLLMVAMFVIALPSCGGDDDPDEPAATTINFSKSDAIVGKWFQTERYWEDGTTTKSEDRTIIFNADGTFEYHWGTGGINTVKGTYTYTPQSKDKGIANAESTNGGRYAFTFENYKDYRYKVSIQQPQMAGIDLDAVCIFGMMDF